MTPAIKTAKKHSIDYRLHEFIHDPACPSYGTEAAQKLSVPEERVFKTLLVSLPDHTLAIGVVPVCAQLNIA